MRYEVGKIIPPRIHNPPNWGGSKPSLITHCVWDNEFDEEYATFGTEDAAKQHCDYYNERHKNER
jgi:hypothetical protein